jgi:hypothetical protein
MSRSAVSDVGYQCKSVTRQESLHRVDIFGLRAQSWYSPCATFALRSSVGYDTPLISDEIVELLIWKIMCLRIACLVFFSIGEIETIVSSSIHSSMHSFIHRPPICPSIPPCILPDDRVNTVLA